MIYFTLFGMHIFNFNNVEQYTTVGSPLSYRGGPGLMSQPGDPLACHSPSRPILGFYLIFGQDHFLPVILLPFNALRLKLHASSEERAWHLIRATHMYVTT
jgi:hypothetical protein